MVKILSSHWLIYLWMDKGGRGSWCLKDDVAKFGEKKMAAVLDYPFFMNFPTFLPLFMNNFFDKMNPGHYFYIFRRIKRKILIKLVLNFRQYFLFLFSRFFFIFNDLLSFYSFSDNQHFCLFLFLIFFMVIVP